MLKNSFFRCKLDGSTSLTMKNRLSSSPRAESRGAVLQFFSILLKEDKNETHNIDYLDYDCCFFLGQYGISAADTTFIEFAGTRKSFCTLAWMKIPPGLWEFPLF